MPLVEVLVSAVADRVAAFDDPDAVLAVDTLGGRAGLTLWSREELLRYPFLGVD